jgi:hypothetical protein
MPNVTEAELTSDGYASFNLQPPFESLNLAELQLDCSRQDWTLSELKAVFSFFPNLKELGLKLKGLADFREKVTCQKNVETMFKFVRTNLTCWFSLQKISKQCLNSSVRALLVG